MFMKTGYGAILLLLLGLSHHSFARKKVEENLTTKKMIKDSFLDPTAGAILKDGKEIIPAELKELGRQSSFPFRVQVGEVDDTSWAKVPEKALSPNRLRKVYKIGGCILAINTGRFSLRTHIEAPSGDYVVKTDGVPPQSSEFAKATENTYVSVHTDIFVETHPKTKQECKSLSNNRKIYIGSINIGSSSLKAQTPEGKTEAANSLETPGTEKLFLTWRAEKDTLAILNKESLAPMVQTGIYRITFYEPNMYYFTFEANWQVKRAKNMEHLAAH
jgi:hypothetical protein